MYAEDQEAATMILSLLDTLEFVEIGSLIASERQKYLECERLREGVWSDASMDLTDWKRKGDEWTYENHYPIMRQYLLQKSLNNRQFAHRFIGDQFIPLIAPQTIEDEIEKTRAFATFVKVKVEMLSFGISFV